jgi:hypothetical protein
MEQGKGGKKTAPQPSLFDRHRSMTLIDMIRESGRLRRQMYGRMVAYEAQQRTITPHKQDKHERED